MNIVEIISGGAQNGAAVHCLLLIRNLLERGHAVTVVCRKGAWIGAQLASGRASVVESELSRWPPAEIWRIAAIAREKRADVLHTHMSRAHFFGVLLSWKTGVPCVATAHSRWIQPHWAFNDRVIAVSEATSRFHRRFNFIRAGRITVVHNFVEPRSTPPSEADRRAARAALGLPGDGPLIGAAGELLPHKGLAFLVRAMPRLLEAAPDARVVLFGDGPADYRDRLRADALRQGVLPKIVWAGHRSDLASLLPALDIFVLPSLKANLPLSALEAMDAGLPVVASNVGGISECVLHEETGLLVRPEDPDGLADALRRLLADSALRRRLGKSGRELVARNFSVERQVPRIEAVLSEAARERPRRSR